MRESEETKRFVEAAVEAEKRILAPKWRRSEDVRLASLRTGLTEMATAATCDSMSPSDRAAVLERLGGLSPKRFGSFFEAFSKARNGFSDSSSVYCDAVGADVGRVEMKASRVLVSVGDGSSTLYGQLMDERRTFASSFGMFSKEYDCNIQQVKPGEFEQLNYCLFFEDSILEFSIRSGKLSGEDYARRFEELTKECGASKLSKESKKALIASADFFEAFGLEKRMCLLDAAVAKDCRAAGLIDELDLIGSIYERSKLGYSGKQHKGNEGEGQFHVGPKNVAFHMSCAFKKAYGYSEFADALRTIKANSHSKKEAGSDMKVAR